MLTATQRLEKTHQIPAFMLPDGFDEPSAIEAKAAHLLDRITFTWPSPELDIFLSRLTMMDRPDRQGFDMEVMSDLFTLYNLNRELAGVKDEPMKYHF